VSIEGFGARAGRFPDASGIDTVKEIQGSFVARPHGLGLWLCDMPTFSANATFDMRPSFCRQARIFLSFAVSVVFRTVSVPSSLSDLTIHPLISLGFSSSLGSTKRNNISMLHVAKTSSPTGC